MSEPTDPREIRYATRMKTVRDEQGLTTGMHTFGLNPVPPSENGQHHHHLTAELCNMDPQTIRERHLQTVMPRTSFDRDQARQQRAEFAVRMQQTTSRDQETLRQRCLAIIRSLEHMEVDKDIALLALEKLCGVDD